ncbi:MAG: NAD(P)H-dependent oxidoreductase [Gammaproteobacteria bacterium]|nr:NAD(P)H-dependent oxidoreductase [Gammaproteobacteria bacterium]
MKTAIISGSHRNPSQSMKVADYIKTVIQERNPEDEVEILSLAGNPLPLWDQGVWEGDPEWMDYLTPLRALLQSCDALVVVSPEWHGQVPAGLKNLFLLCSPREVGHKPALIVTVSAGDGGAYPVAELRMSSYKNNRLCYIPEQIIVRNAEQVLNSEAADNDPKSDQYLRDRIGWVLGILREYGIALRQVRASGMTDTDTFRNGM